MFSTHKTDCHNITEILTKVALKTITLNKSEFQWVIVVEHQLSNFATTCISWWEQVNFQWDDDDDDDEVCFILDQQAKLGFYSASVRHNFFRLKFYVMVNIL